MFRYFPDNYMWSLAYLRCLNSGGLLGDLDLIGRRLVPASTQGAAGDLDAWHTEWHALADRTHRDADRARADGHEQTACDAYLRATHYYQWAEAFLPPGDPRKTPTLERHLDCFRQAIALHDQPITLAEVTYEDTALPAYHVAPDDPPLEPAPGCVYFGGLDSCKEELVPHALEIARRGIHCLVVDGPGQGEALKLGGIRSRHDYEAAGTAAYDHLARDPRIDPDRIAVMGLSLGGYYAPRAAAFEPRFAACVALGAIYDYKQTWQRRLNITPGAPVAAPAHHLFDVLGATDWDHALEILERFTLRDCAHRITCQLLILHGEDDRQVLLEEAEALHDTAGSEQKQLRVFRADEGGTAHCQVDRPQPAISLIADWLADTLAASPGGSQPSTPQPLGVRLQ